MRELMVMCTKERGAWPRAFLFWAIALNYIRAIQYYDFSRVTPNLFSLLTRRPMRPFSKMTMSLGQGERLSLRPYGKLPPIA